MREIGVPYIDTVPEYVVRDDIMHIKVNGVCLCCMPLRIFEEGWFVSGKVMDEHRAKTFPREVPEQRTVKH